MSPNVERTKVVYDISTLLRGFLQFLYAVNELYYF